jgi:TRAP-type C4-dicarboxylate transport system substrate-binding protein
VEKQTRNRVEVRLYKRSLLEEVPESAIYSLPLSFESDAELAWVRERMDPVLVKILARRGLICLGIQHIGNGHIFSTRPRTQATGSLDDFLRSRLWIPDRAGGDTFNSFGVRSTVPLGYEDVRGALEKGKVDTFITSPSISLLARWQTNVATVSKEPLICLVMPLVVHRSEFEKLSESDRATAQQILGDAFAAAARSSRQKNVEAIRLLSRRDTIEFVDFTGRSAWNAWAESVSSRLVADRKLPASVVQELRQHTRSYGAAGR